jgi:hypothetical protein
MFWNGAWCRELVLRETFPESFCIARDRDALVADQMLAHNGVVHWDLNFIRLVHDWRVDIVSSLVNILYFVKLGRGMK